jgi:hypothetical protein
MSSTELIDHSRLQALKSHQESTSMQQHFVVRAWLLVQSVALLALRDDFSFASIAVCFGLINFVLLARAAIVELGSKGCFESRILAIYLMGASLKLGIGIAYVGFCMSNGYEKYVMSYGPESVIGYARAGCFLFLITDLIILTVFLYCRSRFRIARTNSRPSEQSMVLWAVLLTLVSVAMAAISKLGGKSLGSSVLETIGGSCFLPGACMIFLALNTYFRKARYWSGAIGVTLLYFVMNFTLLSKAALIAPLIPWLIHYLQSSDLNGRGISLRSIILRIVGVSTIVAIISLVFFPLVQLVRREVRFGEAEAAQREVELLPHLAVSISSAIPGTSEFADLHKFPANGIWGVASRHSNMVAAAWAVKYVGNNGHTNYEFVLDAITSLVPRAIWQGKPPYQPGRKIAIMTGHSERTNTYVDAGDLAGGLYLNGGALALCIGAALNGLLMAFFYSKVASSGQYNPASICGIAYMQVASAQHFEGGIDGNVQFWFVLAVLMFVANRFSTTVKTEARK